MCSVIQLTTGKEKPARFLETVILWEEFCGNFKRKLNSSLCCHAISVRTCFRVSMFNISVCLFSILLFLCNAIFSSSFKHSEYLLLFVLYAWYLSKISCVMFALHLLSFIFQNLLDSSVSDLRFLWLNDGLYGLSGVHQLTKRFLIK